MNVFAQKTLQSILFTMICSVSVFLKVCDDIVKTKIF